MIDIDAIAASLYGEYVRMVSTLPAKPFEDLPEGGKRVYRRMAQAAVDGLQLTEEKRALGCRCRLVGPWVRCEETQ